MADVNTLQDEREIARLVEIAEQEGVLRVLEVGSKFGGSLWALASRMPVGSRAVSIDLPGGTKAWADSQRSLTMTIARLRQGGVDAHVIWGDSTNPKVVNEARSLGPYDLVFIDANHTLPFIEKDWANYGPMGRLVAFHDISWRRAPEWVGTRIDVPQFWDRVKQDFRHEEIRFDPSGKNNGIGVLWRH